jgi:hypothetical protein
MIFKFLKIRKALNVLWVDLAGIFLGEATFGETPSFGTGGFKMV